MLKGIQNRINNPDIIDIDFIESELGKGKHVIVQFSEKKYTDEQLTDINALCKKHDTYFGVRFYGHYSTSLDCKVLLKIPDVKCLYVDCLSNAEHVEVLSQLKELDCLSLGVFELKATDILKYENFKKLNTLILTETRTKAIDLSYLKEYKDLKNLIICDHTKNLDTLGQIGELEFLSLNSIKKASIAFINGLKNLKSLRLILGGRENIHEVEGGNIEHLDIIWVRGFNDIGNISRFKKLKTLLIEDEIRLNEISFNGVMPNLTDVKVLNCKKLNSISGLENLIALNQIRIARTNIDFDSFINQKLPPALKIIAFYTWKVKQDAEFKNRLLKMGYTDGMSDISSN